MSLKPLSVLCIVLQASEASACAVSGLLRPKEGLLWGVCHACPFELQAASHWPHLRSPALLWCLWPRGFLGGRQKLNWKFRGAFYHLEQDLSWLCDWRELLRSQHHFLPGEENHYQGQVRDKADNVGKGVGRGLFHFSSRHEVGQLIDVEVLTPKSALPGKPDGEGVTSQVGERLFHLRG